MMRKDFVRDLPLPEPTWPEIPRGMNAIQIVAIARTVERVCGTAAAASYLAEAVAAFDKKTPFTRTDQAADHMRSSDDQPWPAGSPASSDSSTLSGAAISPPRHAMRS